MYMRRGLKQAQISRNRDKHALRVCFDRYDARRTAVSSVFLFDRAAAAHDLASITWLVAGIRVAAAFERNHCGLDSGAAFRFKRRVSSPTTSKDQMSWTGAGEKFVHVQQSN